MRCATLGEPGACMTCPVMRSDHSDLVGMPLALVIDEVLVARGGGGELVEDRVLRPSRDG